MNILVIGNGFDLAHGLPTRYIDFLEFIRIIKRKNQVVETMLDVMMAETMPDLNPFLRQWFVERRAVTEDCFELRAMQDLITNNVWVEYFLNQVTYEAEGWIDFESEISNVIKSLDYMRKIRGKKELDYYDLKSYEIERAVINIITSIKNDISMKMMNKRYKIDIDRISNQEYYNDVIQTLQQDLGRLIKCLEIYLVYCQNVDDIEKRTMDIDGAQINKVLSFNYTNTFKDLYAPENTNIEYDFIHGKVGCKEEFSFNIEDNNMVLGIDEYLDDSRKNKETDFIRFKKYFQRIHKETGCKYKNWLIEMEEEDSEHCYMLADKNPDLSAQEIKANIPPHNLFIFGHSLDVTDKDILKDLILHKNVVTTIFYLNKQVYAQQIANLVKVIDQDKLIEKVADETIIFKQQQDMISIV